MRAVILSCGTEIVTGQCVDTNSAWLAQRLTSAGIEVVRHTTVGDDLPQLAEAIRSSLKNADLTIITGGLGPTRDDLTREAVAAALGKPLETNANALRQITDFFRRWQREMPESNKTQALIPAGCDVITNPRGTAPGIAYWPTGRQANEASSNARMGYLVALPGVPGEMKAMYEAFVAPRLSESGSACTMSAKLLCFGISEARLGETIADLMTRGRNPLVGTTASQAILTVRILATATSATEARALIDADRNEVRKRLGSAIFGEEDETLHGAVARLLLTTGKTLATAESCTGGLLGKLLTDISGSSAYFLRGSIVYSNEAKSELLNVSPDLIAQHGAVSEEVARELASNARALAGSDFAFSTTGIAGPGGGSAEKPVGLVYIGLADHHGVEVRRVLLGDHLTRDEIRDRACKTALNMLRLRLVESRGV